MTKNLLAYLFYGNFFMALCAAAWTMSTYYITDLSFTAQDQSLVYLVFLGTLCLYNIARTYSFGRSNSRMQLVSDRQRWVREHRLFIRITAAIAGIGCLYFIQFVTTGVIIALVITGAISLLYYLPLFASRKKGLRDIGVFKIFIIALVWATVTVLLPHLQDRSVPPDQETWLLMTQRFIFIVAITIPFDIRDLDNDLRANLRTIPSRLGLRRSKILTGVLVILFILLSYFQDWHIFVLVSGITGVYIFLLTILVNKSRKDLHYLVFWDGAILVQATLVFLFRMYY